MCGVREMKLPRPFFYGLIAISATSCLPPLKAR